MGTDIHISIQRQLSDGRWEEVEWQKVWHYDGAPKPVDGVPIAPDAFDSRCYDLFAILADVRNGFGFAGVQTGTGWPSIAPNRGVPDDMPDTNRDIGDHSFTWVSLDELKAFDWDGIESWKMGVVTANQYSEMVTSGRHRPSSYAADVSVGGVKIIDPSQYDAAEHADADRTYVRLGWPETARSATYDWPGEVIPWLESLANGRPLRLVMGFDS